MKCSFTSGNSLRAQAAATETGPLDYYEMLIYVSEQCASPEFGKEHATCIVELHKQ
jgi:hypothetical protein